MHTLATHIRPHLDDICALWLFKRYDPSAKKAKLDFFPLNEHGGDVDKDPGIVYVGIGRGEFDEHKGDIGQCSTSLVFADLANRVPLEPLERRALEKVVDWVLQEDTGKLLTISHRQFTIPVIFDAYFESHGRDSLKLTEFGFEMLDLLVTAQRVEVSVERDWATRKEFESPWGRAAAVTSDMRQIDVYAYSHGFPLVVIVNSASTYHTIRANAGTEVDLTEVFEKLKKIDSDAGWYLHHSKKLLICGGDRAPGVKPSSLNIEQLVKLVSD